MAQKDKNNSNNMWILDAYRLASLYACGRGVKVDIQKSIQFFYFCLKKEKLFEISAFFLLIIKIYNFNKSMRIETKNLIDNVQHEQ